MTNTKVLLLMLLLAASVGMCLCLDEVVIDNSKQGAGNAMHDAKKTTESWADRPHDKFTKNLGMKQNDKEEVAQNIRFKAGDAALRATEKVKSAASVCSGASEYTSQKSSEAADMVHQKSKDFIESASEKAEKTAEMQSRAMEYRKEKAGQVHDKADEKIKMPTERATDKASNAKTKLRDIYQDAKLKFHMASIAARKAIDEMAASMEHLRYRLSNANDEGKIKLNITSEETIENAEDAYDGAKIKFKRCSTNAYDATEDEKEKVKGAVQNGKIEATNAYGEARRQIKLAMAADKSHEAKDEAAETYEKAKHKVEEAYMNAKEAMTEGAKAGYEGAKEKESQATGDLGAKMRKDTREL